LRFAIIVALKNCLLQLYKENQDPDAPCDDKEVALHVAAEYEAKLSALLEVLREVDENCKQREEVHSARPVRTSVFMMCQRYHA
jgi:hypothetical protein